MKKQKIDFGKYTEMCGITTVRGEDGTEVKVRNHIPYSQKEEMATEMAERLIMVHDDSCTYKSSEEGKFKKYLVAKYYTDIDTEGATEYEVADFIINNNMWHDIGSFAGWDIAIVEQIFNALCKAVMRTYEDDKCLTKAIRTSFGFLFNGEDISESLAQAEATKTSLLDVVNTLRKAEQDREENIDNGTLKVGGNIINFAKKE